MLSNYGESFAVYLVTAKNICNQVCLSTIANGTGNQGCQEGGQGGHLAPGPSLKGAPSSYFRLNSRNMASFQSHL